MTTVRSRTREIEQGYNQFCAHCAGNSITTPQGAFRDVESTCCSQSACSYLQSLPASRRSGNVCLTQIFLECGLWMCLRGQYARSGFLRQSLSPMETRLIKFCTASQKLPFSALNATLVRAPKGQSFSRYSCCTMKNTDVGFRKIKDG